MHSALIVDRQPLGGSPIGEELGNFGFSCQSVPDNRAAMTLLSDDRSWDLLVTNLRSADAGIGGLELGRLARTLNSHMGVLYLSSAASVPSSLGRHEQVLRTPCEPGQLRAALGVLGLDMPEQVIETQRGEQLVGQQPTGWRVDLSKRRAFRGNVVLAYNIADAGDLHVTILAGGGDDEANCLIAGDAMAAIEEKLRKS